MLDTYRRAIHLVIIEQESFSRDLLQLALSQQVGLNVIGSFADSETALSAVPDLHPEVAVISIELNKLNGIQLGLKLRHLLPHLGVVLLSDSRDLKVISSIPNNLVSGWAYLLNKSAHNVTSLGRAIQAAATQLVTPGDSQEEVTPGHDLLSKLTSRQQDILGLLAQGLSNFAIAQQLQLSEKSVENQISVIYSKLNIEGERVTIHPRVRAVLYYLKHSKP